MTTLHALGGVLGVAVLAYLFVAMLKPEWF
jgi:K+-transporting ATPase KdpF subunit